MKGSVADGRVAQQLGGFDGLQCPLTKPTPAMNSELRPRIAVVSGDSTEPVEVQKLKLAVAGRVVVWNVDPSATTLVKPLPTF